MGCRKSYRNRSPPLTRLVFALRQAPAIQPGFTGRFSSHTDELHLLARATLRPAMSSTANIYVGTAGWSYKDWEGIVYPAQIKKSEHPVEYLARYVDVLEINTSFYGHIKPEWGKLWCRIARAANPHFVFTAKLNRAFTHSPIAVVESTSAETIRA